MTYIKQPQGASLTGIRTLMYLTYITYKGSVNFSLSSFLHFTNPSLYTAAPASVHQFLRWFNGSEQNIWYLPLPVSYINKYKYKFEKIKSTFTTLNLILLQPLKAAITLSKC